MAKVLVSLVSDQTIPNYLLIKEYEKFIDKFLFISTIEMEKKNKTNLIFDTSGIDKKMKRKIIVEEDANHKIKEKLIKVGFNNKEDEFFINLTGGTKLMSISVYEFFKDKQSTYLYLPFGKNVIKHIYLDKESTSSNIKYRISLKEYFHLLGIKYESQEIELNQEQSFELFDKFKINDFMIDHFPRYTANTYFNKLKKSENVAGAWFEDYIYHLFKIRYNLEKQNIAKGLKLYAYDDEEIKNENFDNEIDLAYVKDNSLFTFEAKVSIGKNKPNVKYVDSILYKIGAINKRFGLRPISHLVTMFDFSKLHINSQKNIKRRCEVIGVRNPIDREIIINMYNKIK